MSANIHMFTPRLIRLLQILCQQNDFVSVSTLANQLSTSKRTLFREIQGCNSLLQPLSVELITKSGQGILLDGTEEAKSKVLSWLNAHMKESDFVDMEQRRVLLIAELLKNKSIVKLIQFAQLFKVSEATISNDLSAIESWFQEYQLYLIRRPGMGILLQGEEENVRRAMTDFVHQHMSDEQMSDFLYRYEQTRNVKDYFQQQSSSSILNLLNQEILEKVMDVIKDHQIPYLSNMAESSLIGLIIHLTIAIERLQNKEVIVMDTHLLTRLMDDEDFDKAKRLAEYMEDEFDLVFPQDEIAYILIHIKGAKQKDSSLEPSLIATELQDFALKNLIRQMIARFEEVSGYMLTDDEALMDGLITHLRPTLTRLSYQLKIRNPLLLQIQEQYPKVYEYSLAATSVLQDELKQVIPEDEIGYLALHFGAAIERFKQRAEMQLNLVMGVVCASGIGISSLLSSRLKTLFPEVREIIPLSVEEVTSSKDQMDLIVSTISLKHVKDYIYIHPLLLPVDVERIKEALSKIRLKQSTRKVIKSSSISDVLQELSQINVHLTSILATLSVQLLPDHLSWEELVQWMCRKIAQEESISTHVYEAIMRRELMGSIYLEDMKLLMLHTKSDQVAQPSINYFISYQGVENHLYQKAHTILVLITPVVSMKEANQLLSLVSAATLEHSSLRSKIAELDVIGLQSVTEELLVEWFRNESVKRLSTP